MPPKAAPRQQPARRNPRANATPSEEAYAETNPTVTVDEASQPAGEASGSNATAQDDAPTTAPSQRAPVQRLQSLKRRPASATSPVPGQPGTKAPLKFQPKAAPRKSKEERDRVAKLEAEKQQARLAAAGSGAQESRGLVRGRGANRGIRGRGTFTGPGRGGWQGRGDRHDQGAMSGPFGAGFYAREEAARKVGRGGSRFSMMGTRASDGLKNEPGVKTEGGAVVGGSFMSGGVRIKTEDYGEMYISSEDEEHKNEGPRMNIEQINLVSDEEPDEEDSITNKGKGRAKESRSTGFVLKPIRLDRKEHIERAVGVNIEASSMTSAEMRKRAKERGGPGDSLFLPMDDEEAARETTKKKGKGKTKDVEFVRDERKWKGVYEDEKDKGAEPKIKDEPMDDDDHPAVNLPAATIAPTTGPKPPEPPSSPVPAPGTSDNADPSTKLKPKAKKKRTLKFKDTKPVLQTEEDRQEWARHQEDIRMLDHELRLMDTGPTSLSVPNTDADGNTVAEEDDTPKITEQKEGRVYLIQLPPIVPALIDPDPTPDPNADPNADPERESNNIKPDPEQQLPHPTPAPPSTQKPPSSTTTKKTAAPPTAPTTKPIPHGTFSPGHLGTLKLKQSGRVLLSWGCASLELARGSETEFLQDVVVADAKKHFTIDDELVEGGGYGREGRRGGGKSGWGLGQVMGQAGHGNTIPIPTAFDSLSPLTAARVKTHLSSVPPFLQQWHSSFFSSCTPSPLTGPQPNPTPTSPPIPTILPRRRAAQYNNVPIVRALLRQGCQVDPSAYSLKCYSPKARALTSMPTDPPHKTDTVVAASSTNSTSVFQALLDAGWDINASLGHVGDALSLAVGSDKVPLVQWHLAHGADPNANLRGETYTALELGAIHASTETLDLLLDHDARIQNTSALKLAAHYGRVEVVAFLLDHGAVIDEIPDNENIYEAEREKGLGNALHTATREGKDDVVALLLERGADPKIKDSLGRLALEFARSGGHASVVDMLEGRSC